jgi:hypothetical protein
VKDYVSKVGTVNDTNSAQTLFGKIASIGAGWSGGSTINFTPVTSLIGGFSDCLGANTNCKTVLGQGNNIMRSLGQDNDTINGQDTVFSKLDGITNAIGTGCKTGGICAELNNIESLIGLTTDGLRSETLFGRIGNSADTGGTSTAGSVMGKLNNLIDFNSDQSTVGRKCQALISARIQSIMGNGFDVKNGYDPYLNIETNKGYNYISNLNDWDTMC